MEDYKPKNQSEKVYSRAFKAGKRFYFFDVRNTKNNDFYLTITESKRHCNQDNGQFIIEKFKIFLYKEDFKKFKDELDDVLAFIDNASAPVNGMFEEDVTQSEVFDTITFDEKE